MQSTKYKCIVIYSFLTILLSCISSTAYATRIKDITNLAGVRDNQLIGYGLVVGLDGTGDKTNQVPFTEQSFNNMLLGFGIHMPLGGKAALLKNVAAVAISATLPPFSRIGQKIDVTVSSLGNASSIRGGQLLLSPLKGADGRIYAMAQGAVVVSGFGAQGSDGSKVTVNVTATGSIPNGATIENCVDTPYVCDGTIKFQLTQPDFTTAEKIERAINHHFHARVAQALDASEVLVHIGDCETDPCSCDEENYEKHRYVALISRIENINLQPAELGAKVIVNSRTGTIVIGRHVTLFPVAVSHGNLSVIITERPYVSQPQSFSKGRTVKGSASDINVNQQDARTFLFAPGPSLNDLVDAINRVGAAPGDLIAILEAIKASGSLNADLEVI